MTQDWRIETDASDFLGHQKKRAEVEQRRPVVRKASDLVGPGIGTNAVRVTNWADVLATFDGYYSSLPGASGAPNSTEAFVGYAVSDSELGGVQYATGMTTGVQYSRVFSRNASDAETLGFKEWVSTIEVGSICRLNEWPLSLSAGIWVASPVRNPVTRGNALIMPDGNYGAIQVLRDGWYEVGSQVITQTPALRVLLRICTGSNPDADIVAAAEGTGNGGAIPALNCSAVNYFEAGTIFRTFIYASTAGGTSDKFCYARQV